MVICQLLGIRLLNQSLNSLALRVCSVYQPFRVRGAPTNIVEKSALILKNYLTLNFEFDFFGALDNCWRGLVVPGVAVGKNEYK